MGKRVSKEGKIGGRERDGESKGIEEERGKRKGENKQGKRGWMERRSSISEGIHKGLILVSSSENNWLSGVGEGGQGWKMLFILPFKFGPNILFVPNNDLT